VFASVIAGMLGSSTAVHPSGVFCAAFSALTSLSARAIAGISVHRTNNSFFIILIVLWGKGTKKTQNNNTFTAKSYAFAFSSKAFNYIMQCFYITN
jgi:hypothetical protein